MTEKSVDLPVRLIICVDGTWDTSEGSYDAIKGVIAGTMDSIKSISSMTKNGIVEGPAGKEIDQHVHYLQGVGTGNVNLSDVNFPGMHLISGVNSIFQGATGDGYLEILKEAYKICCIELQQGEKDEIFMFGFSRGAFIVRALASLLQYCGLIKTEHLTTDTTFEGKFYALLQKYMEITAIKIIAKPKYPQKLLSFCKPSPRIRFIGAFDTVKAVLQLPVHNILTHGVPIIDFDLDAPHIVDHFRHALALNEGRPPFNPTLWRSDATSPESSYLEAWFFGFHHDIGGGNDHQGLSLWPLQWILHAATDCGMVLNSETEQYNILFSGPGKIVDTPHELAMKMFDMIKYHGLSDKFKLLLNETSWGFLDIPRDYPRLLTAPPYLQKTKSRVFVHPAAYLLFDISSSFRIQVYEWKLFRTFIRDRFKCLPQVIIPWWEQQTVESILRENSSVSQMRLLVYGRPSSGKESLIARIFGGLPKKYSSLKTPLVSVGVQSNISTPISVTGNSLMHVHYSDGFGAGSSDTLEGVEQFIAQYREQKDPEDQLHAVWYCLDCTATEIPDSEKKFFNMNFGDIPVVVALTKEDELKNRIRQDLAREGIIDEGRVEVRFNIIIAKKQGELKGLPARGYVSVGNALDSTKKLLSETFRNLKDAAVQLTQIKAQRISIKPKIALATEESVRAYTIWWSSKFEGKQIAFSHQHLSLDGGRKLPSILMEPILETFNVRFPGDEKLIQSIIGGPWSELDKYTSNLSDKSIPGNLILLCMVDTILVMARAFYSQLGFDKVVADIAQPLSSAALQLACTWYILGRESRQKAVHSRIRSILSEQDWSPKDKSMASLQMQLIEAVELGLETAQDFIESVQTGVLGGAQKVVTGTAGIAIGSLRSIL